MEGAVSLVGAEIYGGSYCRWWAEIYGGSFYTVGDLKKYLGYSIILCLFEGTCI